MYFPLEVFSVILEYNSSESVLCRVLNTCKQLRYLILKIFPKECWKNILPSLCTKYNFKFARVFNPDRLPRYQRSYNPFREHWRRGFGPVIYKPEKTIPRPDPIPRALILNLDDMDVDWLGKQLFKGLSGFEKFLAKNFRKNYREEVKKIEEEENNGKEIILYQDFLIGM